MEWFSWELVCLRWAPQLIISCSGGSSWLGKWSRRKRFAAAEDELKPKQPPTKVSRKGWCPSATQNRLMRWEWERGERWRDKNGEKLWIRIEFCSFLEKTAKESSHFKHFRMSVRHLSTFTSCSVWQGGAVNTDSSKCVHVAALVNRESRPATTASDGLQVPTPLSCFQWLHLN